MDITPRMADHALLSRTAAAGSMVLLKNLAGTLPFTEKDGQKLRVCVFGIGQIFTVQNEKKLQPWKSGCILDALCADDTLLPDGLLSHKYRSWAVANPDGTEMPLGSLSVDELREENDAAIVVISRRENESTVLTGEENAMLRTVTEIFPRTVLILNTPGFVELSEQALSCAAIVFAGIGGQEMGTALCDLLTGRVVPSGRLAFSWPKKASDMEKAAQNADVFCGWRYYSSFGCEMLYPFGYGLGYGAAELTGYSLALDGTDVIVEATVHNRSEQYPVQELLQVYSAAPSAGKSRPCMTLHGFRKTKLLEPDETQTVTLRFPITECSVYSEEQSAFVLEQGFYDFYVGTNAGSTVIAGSVKMTGSAAVQALSPLSMQGAEQTALPQNVSLYPEQQQERDYAHAHAIRFSERLLRRSTLRKEKAFGGCTADGFVHTMAEYKRGECSVYSLAASINDENLRKFVEKFGFAASEIEGAFGASEYIAENAVYPFTTAEFAGGLCLQAKVKDEEEQVKKLQNCTAFPAAGLLACSFDYDLIRAVGRAVGIEAKEYGVSLVLAPFANPLRSAAQAERVNTWSEDPVLAGIFARAFADGVKPFAAPVLRSAVSPDGISTQTARELSLLSFEIACTAYPAALLPQGVFADAPLCASARRDWAYRGAFMKDGALYSHEPSRTELEESAVCLLKNIRPYA